MESNLKNNYPSTPEEIYQFEQELMDGADFRKRQDTLMRIHRELCLWNGAYSDWFMPLMMRLKPQEAVWDEKYVEKNGFGSFVPTGPVYPKWFNFEKEKFDLRLQCAYLSVFQKYEVHPVELGVNPYKWLHPAKAMFTIWEMEIWTLNARKEFAAKSKELS